LVVVFISAIIGGIIGGIIEGVIIRTTGIKAENITTTSKFEPYVIDSIMTEDCIIREKVGVLFGNPETTPGGRALKFYSSVRLDIRRAETIKNGDKIIGNRVNIKVVKNKVAPPFKVASLDIMYGEGISKEGEIIDIGSDLGILDRSGAWYSYEGNKIGQGRENTKLYLKNNPELKKEIEMKIRNHYGFDIEKSK
jgi:recombination protein RecA